MPLGEALRSARERRRPALVPYLMVDRARRGRYRSLALAARECGASAFELGFPFSDPIADGATLQAASDRALAHGTTWTDLLGALREASGVLPTAVMSYANPFWHRGIDRAFAQIRASGASGLIVPDLSWEEAPPWIAASRRQTLELVLFAAPGTSPARAQRIARATRGFLYLVSRYGTTGRGSAAAPVALRRIVRAARHASPLTPILVGFGVRDRLSAVAALRSGADGVIVGSAIEEALARGGGAAAIRRVLGPLARVELP